jgi:hypothetical protein
MMASFRLLPKERAVNTGCAPKASTDRPGYAQSGTRLDEKRAPQAG